MAILLTIMKVPKGDKLKIKTDSMYTIKGTVQGTRKWEDEGWINTENEDLFKKIKYEMDIRGKRPFLMWVKGHSGNEGNEKADGLAREGTEKEVKKEIDLTTSKEYELEGARLSKLTQKLAYKHIIKLRNIETMTRRGKEYMRETKEEIGKILKTYPTEKKIWVGLKDREIRRPIADFLWKQLHGRLKIGDYWKKIPGYEERSQCKECNTTETMDHILLDCKAEGREEIWEKAEKLWNTTTKNKEKKQMDNTQLSTPERPGRS